MGSVERLWYFLAWVVKLLLAIGFSSVYRVTIPRRSCDSGSLHYSLRALSSTLEGSVGRKKSGKFLMKKVAIFVDVQNVYYTTRQIFNKNFNYNAFWARATHDRVVTKAFAYAIDRGDKKQKEFQNILRAIGFEVKLKPFIQRSDGSAKGDWDVGITIDAMDYSNEADSVILVSGDGDFDLLANKLRLEKGKTVEVYGVAKLTSASLINAASEFVPIESQLLMI